MLLCDRYVVAVWLLCDCYVTAGLQAPVDSTRQGPGPTVGGPAAGVLPKIQVSFPGVHACRPHRFCAQAQLGNRCRGRQRRVRRAAVPHRDTRGGVYTYDLGVRRESPTPVPAVSCVPWKELCSVFALSGVAVWSCVLSMPCQVWPCGPVSCLCPVRCGRVVLCLVYALSGVAVWSCVPCRH